MKQLTLILLTIICNTCAHAQGGTWVWMGGNTNTLTLPTPGFPNARYESAYWTDKQGNFWLFGGVSQLKPTMELLNDLWEFDIKLNKWIAINSPANVSASGNYGVQGVPSPINYPPAIGWGSACWIDTAGDLWMYGGGGYDITNAFGALNVLWRYNIASNEWTWMNGGGISNTLPDYGIQGVASAKNNPGSIAECKSAWVDKSNKLWLFGGQRSSIYNSAVSNDMWQFNIASNEWTWMKGDTLSLKGSYGKLNIESPTNIPCARWSYTKWKDAKDNFYIYGGTWPAANEDELNDVWRYNTKTNNWTWIAGDSGIESPGEYNNQCMQGGGNEPSARAENQTTQNMYCNSPLWMFAGFNENDGDYNYNDLWYFNTANYKWTWVSGSITSGWAGNYGQVGVLSPTNMPPARCGEAIWTDAKGDLWVFGGLNYYFYLNDMWEFIPDPSCVKGILGIQPTCLPVDTIICLGKSTKIVLNNTDSFSIYPMSGVMKIDTSSIILLPTATTAYTVKYNDECNNSNIQIITIHVLPPPKIIYPTDITICSGKTIQVKSHNALAVVVSPISGVVSIDTSGIVLQPNSTTTYTVTYTDYCHDTSYQNTFTINVLTSPTTAFSFIPSRIVIQTSPITLLHNQSTNWDTLIWIWQNHIYAHAPDTSMTFTTPGNYCFTLKATNTDGCFDTITHCIEVVDTAFIAIPNAFTPNGDGKDDIFFPIVTNTSIQIKEFKIFNRWGQMLYDNPSQGWNGMYNGQRQPTDTYVYLVIADYIMPNGQTKQITKQGTVELIR